MRKRKREKDRTWEIRGLKASPAAFIGFPVAFVGCGLVRRLETAESGLDGRKPGNGYVITVRRGRPFREFGSPVFGFLDERAAHWRVTSIAIVFASP